jgi:septum formation protein
LSTLIEIEIAIKNMQQRNIILASRSPRRVELLAQLGVQCEIVPADIDESSVPDEDPAHYVLRLAQEKALAVAATHGERGLAILAADTTVALGRDILGKPADAHEAMAMLSRLSGSIHMVHTAVAVYQSGQLRYLLNSTKVEMMQIPVTVLEAYVASGEPMDKAGAYGIQGRAGAWIARIDGSYSGVMGLPLHETAQLLHAW